MSTAHAKTKIVGLGGTLSESSSSGNALRIALEGAREAGAETEAIAIRSLDLSLYSAGIAFYLWNSYAFHKATWHLFVLAAAACHYAAIMRAA